MRMLRHLLLILLLVTTPGLAANKVRVAVVSDGENFQFVRVAQIMTRELQLLVEGEFELEFVPFEGDWTLASINGVFDAAYADRSIDMVLAVGYVANQIGVSRAQFPKPTFLPLVFDAELTNAPGDGVSSAKRNLSYLAERVPIDDEFATYQRIVPFKKAVLLVDATIMEAIPKAPTMFEELRKSQGVDLIVVSHDGSNNDVFSLLPEDFDALIYTGLPRLPQADFIRFTEDLIKNRIPSFSMNDQQGVVDGMLASDTIETDWLRLARRNALNMQAVMLGEAASAQPVYFEGKQELTINMATARAIGVSPRFDVISEARLLNEEPASQGPVFDLRSVGQLSLENNLGVQIADLSSRLAEDDVRVARSGLLPQLGLSASNSKRRVSPGVAAGQFPESSTDASLRLQQQLYSDDSYSNLAISKFGLQATLADERSARLDAVRAASLAYLDALRAENQLAIRRENLSLSKSNLDLARDRVRVGMSSNADVYRWQSSLASARTDVLDSRAQVDQAREALNQALNRPLDAPFQLQAAKARDPFTMSTDEFDTLVSNPRALSWVTDYFVLEGLERSPELEAIRARIEAKRREIKNRRRDYWLPDFSLDTQYSDNLSQSGVGSGGVGDGEHDWSVSLNASIGLFSGGRRRSELSRSERELRQLGLQYEQARQQLEQSIRASAHIVSARYARIDLSRESAEAARKNLELVTDAYASGTLSILDLLDAQNQSLSAELSASNAVYDFVAGAVDLQRAGANYSFLIPPDGINRENQMFFDYLELRQQQFEESMREQTP